MDKNVVKNIYKKYRVEVLLFFTSCLVSVLVLIIFFALGGKNTNFPITSADSQEYFDLAENILEYKQFIYPNPRGELVHETFRSPAYPFILSSVIFLFGSVNPITFIQIFILGFSVVIIYKIGLLFFDKRISLIAAILYLFEPGSIYHSFFVISETFFVFFLLLSVYLFLYSLKREKIPIYLWFITGLFLGMMTLTRAVGQYIVVIFVIFYIIYNMKNNKNIRLSVIYLFVFLFGFFIVVFPWSYRNYRLYNTFTLSSTPGYVLMKNHLPFFYVHKYDVSLREATEFFFQHSKDDLDFNRRSLENTKELKSRGLNYIKDNFWEYSIFHLIKTVPFFLGDSIRDYIAAIDPPDPNNFQGINISGLILKGEFRQLNTFIFDGLKTGNAYIISSILSSFVWLLVSLSLLFSFFISIKSKDKQKIFIVIFFLSLIAFFAGLTGPVSNARYRLPTEPFMFILTAYSFNFLYKKLKDKSYLSD